MMHNPTINLIDIGVNLTSKQYNNQAADLVSRARDAGVQQLILIGSDIDDSRQALALAEQLPGCRSTVGIHPHQASGFNTTSSVQLLELSRHPKACALGEMGLDFNRNYSTPAQQLNAFERQLELSAESGLPIYLHQRDAHTDFLRSLKQYRDQFNQGVVHCFTGTEQELNDYLELDLHIGITGWVCDERRGHHLHPLLKHIPLNRLMLETDAPYLLPRTLPKTIKPKPRHNEPAYLTYVLETVADCLEMSQLEVAEITTGNAVEFFALKTAGA